MKANFCQVNNLVAYMLILKNLMVHITVAEDLCFYGSLV